MINSVFPVSARKGFVHLALIVALAACSSGSESPMADANAAVAQQDYRAARIHLMTALRENSQDPQANLLFAEVLLELGDAVGAEAALQKLADQTDYADPVRLLRGRVHLLKGQNDAALALAEDPNAKSSAGLQAIRVMALWGLDRSAEAQEFLAQALQDFPQAAELLWIKGNRQLELGDLDGAKTSVEQALALAPRRMEALLLAGRLALAKADGAAAIDYFEKIQAIRPDNVPSLYLLGAARRDLGDDQAARQDFEAVLKASPRHPWATYFLAQMDFDAGQTDKAFDRLQSSKADISPIPQATRLAGLLEVRRGNYEQAIERLTRYLAQNPADADTVMALAQSLSAAGSGSEAYRAIAPLAQSITAPASALELAEKLATENEVSEPDYGQRIAALKQDDAIDQIFTAEHAIIGQDWLQAEKLYTQLLKNDHPQKVMLLNNAAMVKLRLAKGKDAIGLAEQAHALAPGDPMVKDTLGWILLQTRTDKTRALNLIQEAAKAAGDNPEIRWHLAQALAANRQIDAAQQVARSLAQGANAEQSAAIDDLLAWL